MAADKRVHIFHIDIIVVEYAKRVHKSAGIVGDLDAKHIVYRYGFSGSTYRCEGTGCVAHDKAKYAVFGRFGER